MLGQIEAVIEEAALLADTKHLGPDRSGLFKPSPLGFVPLKLARLEDDE